MAPAPVERSGRSRTRLACRLYAGIDSIETVAAETATAADEVLGARFAPTASSPVARSRRFADTRAGRRVSRLADWACRQNASCLGPVGLQVQRSRCVSCDQEIQWIEACFGLLGPPRSDRMKRACDHAQEHARDGSARVEVPAQHLRPAVPNWRWPSRQVAMLTPTRRTVLAQLACCGCSGLFDQSTRRPTHPRLGSSPSASTASARRRPITASATSMRRFCSSLATRALTASSFGAAGAMAIRTRKTTTRYEQLANRIESYGLQVFSIQAGVRGVNPVSDDPTERAEYTRQLTQQVDLAVKFGCDCMGVWSPVGRRTRQARTR